MKAKIEWYQEVLTLEPGSKVFFPLARALYEDGQGDSAVQVLRHGLELHPEFLEARIFLIQLLHDTGEAQGCRKELERMTNLLAAYPGFWKAWSDVWKEKNPDIGLVLGYMAIAGEQPDLSLRRLLELGLETAAEKSCEKTSGGSAAGPAPKNAKSRPAEVVRSAAPIRSAAGSKKVSDDSDDEGPNDNEAALADDGATVRTRSMAEVLAEQGDIGGALEIYRELAEATSNAKERKELQRRMVELEAQVGAMEADGGGSESVQAGKEGLRTILESLADRLEARAR